MAQQTRRKNHIVSAGYLRFFGKRPSPKKEALVTLVDLDAERGKAVREGVSVRKALFEYDFSVYDTGEELDDQLEVTWSEREAFALPRVRGSGTARAIIPETVAAAKVLMSLHFARSYVMKDSFGKAWDRTIGRLPAQLRDNPKLHTAFVEDHGREPSADEVEQLVAEYVEQHREANTSFVEAQAEQFNRFLDHVGPRDTRISQVAPGHGLFLLTTDCPVVLVKDGAAHRPGGPVKVGEEGLIVMPLTKRALFSVGSLAFPPVLDADLVRAVNDFMTGEAMRFVAIHPEQQIDEAAPTLWDRIKPD